jgi:hypothetical protein
MPASRSRGRLLFHEDASGVQRTTVDVTKRVDIGRHISLAGPFGFGCISGCALGGQELGTRTTHHPS